MLLSTRIKMLLALWFAAEILVFVGIVHLVGLGLALLAGLATTLLGASMLKRAGAAAMIRLRGVVQGRHDGRLEDVLDGALTTLAAVALILPGFLSDAVGVALAIPVVRGRASRWVRSGGLGLRFESGAGTGPRTIDLERDQWSRTRPPRDGGELVR